MNGARGAATGVAVLLLFFGLVGLGLGFILRATGILGTLFLVGGVYLSLHGAMLLLEARFEK